MTMKSTIATIALLTLVACGAPPGGSDETTGTEAAAQGGGCQIGLVLPGGGAGYYSAASCPAAPGDFEALTDNSAYDGWTCWGYGPGESCCAASASSKPLCDAQTHTGPAATAGACRVGFVFPGSGGKWSGGYYTLANGCPTVVSGNVFELVTGNAEYANWTCWDYGTGQSCCAPDASSKAICDSQLR